MSKRVIELTPRSAFGYGLIFIGLMLLAYTILNCILLANGTIQPLKIGESSYDPTINYFLGIILQIGMYGLLIGASYAIIKTGISIAKS